MYDSNYPSNKKRNYCEETAILPTAERSHFRDLTTNPFLERTPTRLDYASPAKHSARLSDARRSINQAIQMVSASKSRNQEAIEQVRNVNLEIASSLSSCNPNKSVPFEHKNRTADRTRDDYSRAATSQFEWQHPAEEDLRRSHKDSATTENAELKSRLNEEIRKNNELIGHIKQLQRDNANLRSSASGGQSANINNITEENRYLRSQLQNTLPIDALQELRKLKEENHLLRRDTIALLKKSAY